MRYSSKGMIYAFAAFLLGMLTSINSILADTTPPVPTREEQAQREVERQKKMESALVQFNTDLKSGDAAKVAAAMATLHSVVMMTTREFDAWRALDSAIAAGKFAEVEAMCQESALANAEQPWVVGRVERARALALNGEGKAPEALAAAKSYYNVCQLDQTNDAITLIATCLVKARPDEKGLAKRFKQQQLAAATVPPSAADADLGTPILPTIIVDPKPYEAAINAAVTNDSYPSYIKRGNLLLLADRTVEARKVFEEGHELAEGYNVQPAIENVARAIRAATGSVGQANAFIVSVQGK